MIKNICLKNENIKHRRAEAYPWPRQTSKIESFAITGNGFKPVTIILKLSI